MDFAKNMWAPIWARLDSLPLATKLLLGSLVVILLVFGMLVMVLTGVEETSPVGLAGANSGEAIAQLAQAGIPVF